MPNWRLLAQSIADGEAVLLLGPDAIPFYRAGQSHELQGASETSFSYLSRQRVVRQLNGRINHFYRRDNLFQFVDPPAKNEALKCVRDTARDGEWLPDTELLRQIVAIPFHLVLSLNPDKHLFSAYANYWQEPQFDYFTTKDKKHAPKLEYPTADNPLIFNLCGSVLDNRDSVILDYHDLFQLIKNLLMDNGISDLITRKLQETDRYILLGFDLERWYFQLLLYYLSRLPDTPFDNRNESFPILSKASRATQGFVMKQFNIEHIATTRDNFEELYKACAEIKILRELRKPDSPIESQIRALTVQGNFQAAFDLLEQHAPETAQQLDMPHLRGRYVSLLKDYNARRIGHEQYDVERNRIRYTLLTFAGQFSKP